MTVDIRSVIEESAEELRVALVSQLIQAIHAAITGEGGDCDARWSKGMFIGCLLSG